MLVGGGAAALVFDRNTIIHTNSSVLYAYGAAMPGLVYTNNISQHHHYGIMGDGATTGNPTIAAYFPGGIVQCNVLAGGSASLYPTPNAFPTVAQWTASFVNAAAGDYRLIPGSVAGNAPAVRGSTPGVDVARLNDALQGTSTTPPDEPPPRTSRRSPMPAARTPSTVGALDVGGRHRIGAIRMGRSSITSGTGATKCWCAPPICRRRRFAAPNGSAPAAERRGRRRDAPQSRQGSGQARRRPGLAGKLRRAHGQCGGRRSVLPVAADARLQQQLLERLALPAVQWRRRCARALRWPASARPAACP